MAPRIPRKYFTPCFKSLSHLVLPLTGHYLPVGSGDSYTGEQASLVVSLHDMAAERVLVPDRAVVGALKK